MITLLRHWQGGVDVDDTHFDSAEDAVEFLAGKHLDNVVIKLSSKFKHEPAERPAEPGDASEYRIVVKQYMTKKATPEFDFMKQWNNDKPMPVREMIGTKEKETRGMVYMKLHGFAKKTITCMCCGKELTNPVSRHYGIGPICLSKIGIPLDMNDVEGITEALEKITWEGWIIKSSITEEERV